mgnify:CR=1 FL=1
MPEMLEGLIRAEMPVDPANPLTGSYFDPNKSGGSAVPSASGGSKRIVYDSNGDPVK